MGDPQGQSHIESHSGPGAGAGIPTDAGRGVYEDPASLVSALHQRPEGSELLLEFSTEVCNQVGGIYQVLRSKAAQMVERWRHRYILVGPYVESSAAVEFEPGRPTGKLAELATAIERQGVIAHFGSWLIPGRPRVILVEHSLNPHELDEAKYLNWERHRISFPPGDASIDMAVSFGDASLRLLRAACEVWPGPPAPRPPRVVAHFHEWLAGLAIPNARAERLPVATVFTTHATLLGRYMASNEDNFYDTLGWKNHQHEAQRYNVTCQHTIERACAHGAHVFTTVSAITGEECRTLLGREPDLLTPNGLDVSRYDVGHEFQTQHANFKDRIHRFVMGYFFPSYTFDLERTLYFFSSGRFEPHNKGFDLCLEALARLNRQLKDFDLPVTVVFFIVTRRPTLSLNPQVLQRRGVLNELREVCAQILSHVGEKFFPLAAAGQRVNLDSLVDQYWALRYRRTQQALRSNTLPPVVTHILEHESSDPVLNHIRTLGLFNRPEDPVKIVYHPDFINPANPLWGVEYEQFVRGCHLGVFPSAYEPWGYTPLESMAMGVPAITSDLAGFGGYVAEHFPRHDEWGLTVLKRRGRSFHDSAADLARWMLAYCRLDRRGRITLRNEVERHADEFDWLRLARHYHAAHDMALARAGAESTAP